MQPSLTSTVFTATYPLALVEGELRSITLSTWANCDRSNRGPLDAEVLGFIVEPDFWEAG